MKTNTPPAAPAVSSGASLAVQDATIVVPQPNTVTDEDPYPGKKALCIETLNGLYDNTVQASKQVLDYTIQVGACVQELWKLLHWKRPMIKAEWQELAKAGKVRFGWVQALRYAKIYTHRELLKTELQKLGAKSDEVTIEAAYRLIGSQLAARNKDKAKKPAKKPVYKATYAYGVNNQKFQSRQLKLDNEISETDAQLSEVIAKRKNLRETRTAMKNVLVLLNNHEFLGRAQSRPEIEAMLEKVEHVFPDLKTFRQVYILAGATTAEQYTSVNGGADYRTFLLQTYEANPDVVLEKFKRFCADPKSAMASDPDFQKSHFVTAVHHFNNLSEEDQKEALRLLAEKKK